MSLVLITMLQYNLTSTSSLFSLPSSSCINLHTYIHVENFSLQIMRKALRWTNFGSQLVFLGPYNEEHYSPVNILSLYSPFIYLFYFDFDKYQKDSCSFFWSYMYYLKFCSPVYIVIIIYNILIKIPLYLTFSVTACFC